MEKEIYYINNVELKEGMILRHIESGDLETIVSYYDGELFIEGKKDCLFPLHQFTLSEFEIFNLSEFIY